MTFHLFIDCSSRVEGIVREESEIHLKPGKDYGQNFRYRRCPCPDVSKRNFPVLT